MSNLDCADSFDDSNQRATYDTKISTLSEYLYEYCNFGCAHFVLRKVKNKNPLTIVRGFFVYSHL